MATSAFLFLLALTALENRGAAVDNAGHLYTWGPQGARQGGTPILPGNFTAGGCWTPTFGLVLEDESNSHALIAQRGGQIDRNVYLADCLETTLFGRKGILLIHRNAQVRFYEPPETPSGNRWPYTEIYSIYTPSAQTGLLVRDINNDGRPDIYCGNYWIESPAKFELPWRIFAIHPHYKQPLSASFRLVEAFGGIVAAQREFDGLTGDMVFSVFRKPRDIRQLWDEQPVRAKVRRPQGLAAVRQGIVVGEDAGADSRLILLRTPNDPGTLIAKPGAGILNLFPAKSGVIAVTRDGSQHYRLPN